MYSLPFEALDNGKSHNP